MFNLKSLVFIGLFLICTILHANNRPEWFIPPPLDPTGVELETLEIDEGVFALLSNTPFADNTGFVVGENSVLVIDAHFTGEMGEQIIAAVKKVTDLPIKYLVNLNAFGDHVFGNYVFPDSTTIIAHEKTIDFLKKNSLQKRKEIISVTVGGSTELFKEVEDRLPSVSFKTKKTLDLGNKIVELHYFGPGMSPSDTVLYVPSARAAWTGNLIFGKGSIPWARSETVSDYLKTMKKFKSKIDPVTIVAGHGKISDGSIVESYISYLDYVLQLSKSLKKENIFIEDYVKQINIPAEYIIEDNIKDLMEGFHKWNVLNSYKQIKSSEYQSKTKKNLGQKVARDGKVVK